MSQAKIIIFLVILFTSINVSNANIIEIKVELQNEIITNVDIENEKKYLFFLNPKLKELEKSKTNRIAKESLITEIIKKKELEKFFDLSKEINQVKVIENNLLRRKNIKDRAEFFKILSHKNIDYEAIKKKLLIETYWNSLIYEKYSKNLIIDENKLRKNILDQFNKKKQKFTYNLSEISITQSNSESFDQKLKKIDDSIKEIGFENTANLFSASTTSSNGGLIGWINELQISNDIINIIKNLKINQVSEPIKIQNGYILIKVNNKKELKQEINLEEELKKLVNKERNRQLNTFSIIFYKRLKKNIEINEY